MSNAVLCEITENDFQKFWNDLADPAFEKYKPTAETSDWGIDGYQIIDKKVHVYQVYGPHHANLDKTKKKINETIEKLNKLRFTFGSLPIKKLFFVTNFDLTSHGVDYLHEKCASTKIEAESYGATTILIILTSYPSIAAKFRGLNKWIQEIKRMDNIHEKKIRDAITTSGSSPLWMLPGLLQLRRGLVSCNNTNITEKELENYLTAVRLYTPWSSQVRYLALVATVASLLPKASNIWQKHLNFEDPSANEAWIVGLACVFGTMKIRKEIMKKIVKNIYGRSPDYALHQFLNVTQAFRTCIVILNELILHRKFKPRDKRLKMIATNFKDALNEYIQTVQWRSVIMKTSSDSTAVQIRGLLSYADIVQCQKFIHDSLCGHADGVVPVLREVARKILESLSNDNLKRTARMLNRAVNTAPRPWLPEGMCLHEQILYPLGMKEKADGWNEQRAAVIALLNAVIVNRTDFSGAGWISWYELFQTYGENSPLRELRNLWDKAKDHPPMHRS